MNRAKNFPITASALAIFLGLTGSACAIGLMEIITAPKTLFDRVIEARSTSDIVEDNRIVLEVNAIMATLGTFKASTEIYEQRLLITGLFDDKKLYNQFLFEVKKISNIKKLYWHIRFLNELEQKNAQRPAN